MQTADLMPRPREYVWSWASRIIPFILPAINLAGDGKTTRVRKEGSALIVEALPADATRGRAFGITAISGTKITLADGWVESYNSFTKIPGGEVSVGGTISAPHLIIARGKIVEGRPDVSGCTLLDHSIPLSTFNGHVDNEWRRPLWIVYLASGKATVAANGDLTPGVIDLKGWFGP